MDAQDLEDEDECCCGNPEFGFRCSCKWVKEHPGDIDFNCSFCGLYTASEQKCNNCNKS